MLNVKYYCTSRLYVANNFGVYINRQQKINMDIYIH